MRVRSAASALAIIATGVLPAGTACAGSLDSAADAMASIAHESTMSGKAAAAAEDALAPIAHETTMSGKAAAAGEDAMAPLAHETTTSGKAVAAADAKILKALPTLTYAQAPREPAPRGGPDVSFVLAPFYGGGSPVAQLIAPRGGTLANLATGTINQIIVNTEAPAFAAFYETPLSYYTRLDLRAAAGYFADVSGTLALTPTDRVNTAVSIGRGALLENNGTITADTRVNLGGTLSGRGTVAGVNVLTGATLAPGAAAAIGTLNVSGPLVFAAGSTFVLRATPAQADRATVSGTATLGAAAVVVSAGGSFLPRTRYTVLSAAGGISGSFGAVSTNLAFLTPSLSYDANNAFLNLARNDVSFTAVAAIGNQRAVGTALTGFGVRPAGDGGSALLNGLYTLSADGARAAYDQLSGESIAASQNTNIRAGRAFSASVGDQIALWRVQPSVAAPVRELADLPASREIAPTAPVRHYRVWVSANGGAININGNAGLGTARQTSDFYGGDVGGDTEVVPGLVLGGSLGGSGTDFSVSQRASSGSAVGFHASVYGAFTAGANYLQSITSFSDFANTTNRNVGGFGGFGVANERASFNSTEIRERLEAGHSISRDLGFGTPEVRFTPFVALEIAQLATGRFSEYTTNGVANPFALQSFGQTVADVPGFLGVRIDGVTSFGGLSIRPVASLAYLHEFSPQRNLTNGLVSLPGATFLVQGARPARDAAQVKLGAETSLNGHLSIFANFEGEFAGVEQVYGGKGGLRFVW